MPLCSSCIALWTLTTDLDTISGAMILRLLGSQQPQDKSNHTFKIHQDSCYFEGFCKKMLVWTRITVSAGAMGKCFWDRWIDVNGNETEQHGAKSSFLSWGSPLIQRRCQLSCDTNTAGTMFNYHISFQKVLLSFNMIVHIFSANNPYLTAVLNLSIQLGQLILWLPPPQAGTAHAVWREGETGKCNLGRNVYEGSKAWCVPAMQGEPNSNAPTKKEICLCQLGILGWESKCPWPSS